MLESPWDHFIEARKSVCPAAAFSFLPLGRSSLKQWPSFAHKNLRKTRLQHITPAIPISATPDAIIIHCS